MGNRATVYLYLIKVQSYHHKYEADGVSIVYLSEIIDQSMLDSAI
jgi:hypothetical protein